VVGLECTKVRVDGYITPFFGLPTDTNTSNKLNNVRKQVSYEIRVSFHVSHLIAIASLHVQ